MGDALNDITRLGFAAHKAAITEIIDYVDDLYKNTRFVGDTGASTSSISLADLKKVYCRLRITTSTSRE